ncbi:Dicer-like protein 1 [Rhodotorula kratochvilovae]
MAASLGELVPRLFQQVVTEQALKSNVLVRADTGSGKTLIAIMLLRQIAAAPQPAVRSKRLIVFLTPTTTLVHQQAQVVESQTTLRVKSFVGAQGVDYWKREQWQQELNAADVVVLTPAIWLNVLNNAYFDLRDVDLMIFDEAHHAQKSHPYALVMRSHYHPLKERGDPVPRILGLAASPIWNVKKPREAVLNLEATLDVRILEVAKAHRDEMQAVSPRATEMLVEHDPPSPQQAGLPSIYHQLDGQLDPLWRKDERARDRLQKAQALFGSAGVEIFLRQLLEEHKLPPYLLAQLDALAHKPAETSALSHKVLALVNVLEEFRDEPTFHAILFVEQRHHALLLADLLKRVASLQGFVRPAALVGHGGRVWRAQEGGAVEKEVGMAVKEQQETVAAFRTGKVNLLVATRVAEEGLDVPSCHLVIRFDPLTTITGYVQSRGRARAAHARYVVIAEKGSPDAQRYRDYVKQEQDLLTMYAARRAEDDDSLEPDLDNLPTYTTRVGALLTHASSIALVAQFCQLLRYDAFTPLQKPEYTTVGRDAAWTATLHVPRTAALEENVFVSKIMPSKKAAKQNASFQTAIALHQAGALDDHLLPIRESKAKGAKDADGREVDTAVAPKHLQVELVQHFGNVYAAATAFVHVVEIARASGRIRLALVCGARMHPLGPTTLFEREGEPMMVHFVAVAEHGWTDEAERAARLAQLEQFNRDCTRIVLNRRIENERFFALWAPVTAEGHIDWPAIEDAFEPFDAAKVSPGDLVVLPFRRPNVRIGRFEFVRGDVDTNSTTAEIEYNAPERKRKVIEKYSCYPRYVAVCWGHAIPHDSIEPVVQLTPLDCRPDNALVPPAQRFGHPYKPYRSSRNFPQSVLLRTTLPTPFFQAFSLVPSLNRLIAGRTSAATAIERFSLPPLDLALLDEALTSPANTCGWDYQRLEHVGDSPLKLLTSVHIYLEHPRADEDRLTRLRENSVDNRFLRQRSRDTGLSAHILPHTLRMLTFVPETADDAIVAEDGLSMTKRLPRRLLSDTVEATLGAALLTGSAETKTDEGEPALKVSDAGLQRVLEVGDRLGLCFGGTEPWHLRQSARKLLDVEPQAAGLAFRPVEEAMGYKIEKQGKLLQQALTHRSWVGQGAFCYEREEYLGDALLDTRVLTFLRALLVSNGTLAALAVRKLQLHRVSLHSSPALEVAMRDAAREAEGFAWSDVADGHLTFMWAPPKVLGDVVEALLAVVFIDRGLDVAPVFAVLDRLYADILPHLRNEGTRDPYSRLVLWKDAHACTEFAIRVTPLPPSASVPTLPSTTSRGTHNPLYSAACMFHGRALATRESESKAVARQLAAREALRVLEGEGRCGCREAAREAREGVKGEEEDGEEDTEEQAVPPTSGEKEEDEEEETSGETTAAEDSAAEPEPLLRVRKY